MEEEEIKKTTFVESDSDVIPNSEPKYKRIVCYKDSESDIELGIDRCMNISVENNITNGCYMPQSSMTLSGI